MKRAPTPISADTLRASMRARIDVQLAILRRQRHNIATQPTDTLCIGRLNAAVVEVLRVEADRLHKRAEDDLTEIADARE